MSLSQVDGMYFVCNIDDFKFLADMIQHIPLNLRSRYVFCTAPLNRKEPFVCTTLLKVSYFFPSKNVVFVLDQEGFGALGLYLAAVFVVDFAIRSFESILKVLTGSIRDIK